MDVGVAIFLIFASTLALLLYKYERPSSKRKKLTGRGGDFAE
jgi:hypothetical protein